MQDLTRQVGAAAADTTPPAPQSGAQSLAMQSLSSPMGQVSECCCSI